MYIRVLLLITLSLTACDRADFKIHNKVVPDATKIDDYGSVPEFKFTSHLGKPLTLSDMRGKVWVANFFFTDCTKICPMMTAELSKLQEEYGKDGLKIVSISVNPETDTPEKMAAHAEQIGADSNVWLFLTGDKQQIIDLSVNGFHLPANQNPDSHSQRFALVDRDGKIRGYYRSDDEKDMKALHESIEKLLRKPA